MTTRNVPLTEIMKAVAALPPNPALEASLVAAMKAGMEKIRKADL